MRITGLEPARHGHQNLNLARLPIPPYPLVASALPSIRYRHIKINEKYLKIVLTKWLRGDMVAYTSNELHNQMVLTDIGGATFE